MAVAQENYLDDSLRFKPSMPKQSRHLSPPNPATSHHQPRPQIEVEARGDVHLNVVSVAREFTFQVSMRACLSWCG